VIGFTLAAIDAEKIRCAASASNRFKDKASVGIKVDDGSLINYRASAYAQAISTSDHSAFASQNIGSSIGENIELNAETSDKGLNGAANHKAEASTEVSSSDESMASITNFDSETACIKSNNYLDLYAIHGAWGKNPGGSISGAKIISEGSASGPANSEARYKATIKDGSIEGFFDQGTEFINDEVIAISLEAPANWLPAVPPYDTMNGNTVDAEKIKFESSASNGLGDKSSESTIAKDVKIQNWFVSGSFASPDKAWVEKKFETISGNDVVMRLHEKP
jgi:hypothetical protein